MEKDNEQKSGQKVRTTLFIDAGLLDDIDYITGMQFALKREKATRTDIVNEALTEFRDRYVKKNGPIPIK